MERFNSHVKAHIMKAKTDQTAKSQTFSNIKEETKFGVSEPKFDKEHTDKQMYSCGSLAPKLKRGGGCMDHGF